jgi:prepilin-type N-terminal cleavage/methylation domain-containing protein
VAIRYDGRPLAGRAAFTLVELLVVIVIVSVLSGLMLGGMAAARKGVKIDRTRNTIRKIHEIVMPQYENYLRRRAPASELAGAVDALDLARLKLCWVRRLITSEMPDTWSDVGVNTAFVANNLPVWLQTGPVYAYAAAKSANPNPTAANGGAECLYLIASRGSGEPDAMERFRTEEVGDVDGDGAPEFLDAWGRPIGFIRWAPGFTSAAQPHNTATFHDPFDQQRIDGTAFALVPLVVSGGPNGILGLAESPAAGWSSFVSPAPPGLIPIVGRVNPDPGTVTSPGDAADNITNHDLSKK